MGVTDNPLSGIVVLDFTIAMAGPLATQRLGDMGADVIKVESKAGDLTRIFALADVWLDGETTSYLSLNRNKRSIVIDLKSDEGKSAALRLAEKSDIVVQNFRPGVAERLGISYEDIRKVNPNVIYATISGYGLDGPMRDAAGQDLLVQAYSGMTLSAGVADGPPHPAPTYFVDTSASHLATTGILAALHHRNTTGEGQHIDTDLLAGAMEAQSQEIMTFLTTKQLPQRSNAPYASTWLEPPYGVYRTQDGWIALPQNDMNVLAEVIGSDELRECVNNKPSSDPEATAAWKEKVYTILERSLHTRKSDVWISVMRERRIWCEKVNSIGDLVASEQAQTHLATLEHPTIGNLKCVAPAIRFSNSPDLPMKAPPKLGENTDEVLADAGYDANSIRSMRKSGVVS